MNPDPNTQPEQPAPEAPATPDAAPAANPFGGAPVSSDAPVAPAPSAPIGSSPNSDPAPDFNAKSKKKKLITLIAIIVGIVVVLGIAAVIALSFFTVSKADYRDATKQFNNVSTASSTLQSDGSSLEFDTSDSTTDTQFNNDIDAVKSSLAKMNDENKALSKMKAVKVGDGKKLYDTFNTKLSAYSAYVTDLSTSLKSFRPAIVACGDDSSSSTTAQANAKVTACVDALGKATDLPNADIKTFATALLTQYKALQSVTTQIAAITDPYGKQYTQYSALRDQGYDIQDKISDASSDYSSNVEKHAKDVDPSDQANALGEFLENKQK